MTKQNKRVILVTGASRGVGKGIAEGIAQPSDIIICAARSMAEGTKVQQFGFEINSSLEDTVKNINQKGAQGIPYEIDLNKPDEILNLATFVKEEFGKVFLSGKNILQVDSADRKYLKPDKKLSSYLIKENYILITRSVDQPDKSTKTGPKSSLPNIFSISLTDSVNNLKSLTERADSASSRFNKESSVKCFSICETPIGKAINGTTNLALIVASV